MEVLVVDDNIAYKKAVSIAASNKNWTVVTGSNVNEAWELLLSHRPDLVISDYLLDNGTVIELLKKIKCSHISIPVIVVSAADQEEFRINALDNGAWYYFDKLEFDLQKIYEVLDQIR